MRREVRALEVHCSFVEEGCSWKGEVFRGTSDMKDSVTINSLYLFILKHGFIKI